MLATFQNAMQKRSVQIAGVKLGPVTLAQAYCLHAWDSPIIRGGEVGLADFAVALWTCANPCWPFERFVDAVNAGKPERALIKLGRRYDLAQFDQDSAALVEWVAWHCAVPPRFVKDSPGKRGACAPWPMIVAVQIMPLFGEVTTWTMPAPRAMAYKIAMDNAQGDTSWKSEAEQEQGYADVSST